jgi:hypothetical protein
MMDDQIQNSWLSQESFILSNGLDVNSVGYQGSKNNLASTIRQRFLSVV